MNEKKLSKNERICHRFRKPTQKSISRSISPRVSDRKVHRCAFSRIGLTGTVTKAIKRKVSSPSRLMQHTFAFKQKQQPIKRRAKSVPKSVRKVVAKKNSRGYSVNNSSVGNIKKSVLVRAKSPQPIKSKNCFTQRKRRAHSPPARLPSSRVQIRKSSPNKDNSFTQRKRPAHSPPARLPSSRVQIRKSSPDKDNCFTQKKRPAHSPPARLPSSRVQIRKSSPNRDNCFTQKKRRAHSPPARLPSSQLNRVQIRKAAKLWSFLQEPDDNDSPNGTEAQTEELSPASESGEVSAEEKVSNILKMLRSLLSTQDKKGCKIVEDRLDSECVLHPPKRIFQSTKDVHPELNKDSIFTSGMNKRKLKTNSVSSSVLTMNLTKNTSLDNNSSIASFSCGRRSDYTPTGPPMQLECRDCSSCFANIGIKRCVTCHLNFCERCFIIHEGNFTAHRWLTLDSCCDQCEGKCADIHCQECCDKFCESCFLEIHSRGRARQKHHSARVVWKMEKTIPSAPKCSIKSSPKPVVSADNMTKNKSPVQKHRK
eukprot:TRINITY_DN1018_c0_g1_i5.p1 TRINITY_DN1018_c0_g1~~TRINITY_DN1018_c0_g1_i5.p1  ORF type:complete len:538 (-),score=34.97 TRINITY_DN1018_c0_g1_i5:521-2134(-)